MIKKPPQDAKGDLHRFTRFWLQVLDVMAFAALAYGTDIPALEPIFILADFAVSHSLQRESDEPGNAGKVFRKQRLLNYKFHRDQVRKLRSPRLFSLALTSVFKGDQISWMSIVWRSSLVGGISIYNVWYWFHGIEFLTTTSCSTYIFFFRKTNISGPARTFFKFISIGYITYGGSLTLVVLAGILALLGTISRSLIITFVLIPNAHIRHLFEGFVSHRLQRLLSRLLDTQTDFLNIPSIENLLKAVAYLASSPKEGTSIQAKEQEKSNRSLWCVPVI